MIEQRLPKDFIQYDGTQVEWHVGNSEGYAVLQAERGRTSRQTWNVKRRNGKGQDWRRDKDKKGCKAAIVQALRYYFGLKVKDIVRLTGYASQTISSITVSSSLCVVPWYLREHKEVAIVAAANLIEASRYHVRSQII